LDRFYCFASGALPGGNAGGVNRLKQVRIFGKQGEAIVAVFQQVFHIFHAVSGKEFHGFIGRVEKTVQDHGVIAEFKADIDDAILEGLFGDKTRQGQAVFIQVND